MVAPTPRDGPTNGPPPHFYPGHRKSPPAGHTQSGSGPLSWRQGFLEVSWRSARREPQPGGASGGQLGGPMPSAGHGGRTSIMPRCSLRIAGGARSAVPCLVAQPACSPPRSRARGPPGWLGVPSNAPTPTPRPAHRGLRPGPWWNRSDHLTRPAHLSRFPIPKTTRMTREAPKPDMVSILFLA